MGGASGVPATKLVWRLARRRPPTSPGLKTKVLRRIWGTGLPWKVPTSPWRGDHDGDGAVAVHVELVDGEGVVAQVVVLVASDPGRLGEGEAERSDADEVVGEVCVEERQVAVRSASDQADRNMVMSSSFMVLSSLLPGLELDLGGGRHDVADWGVSCESRSQEDDV
jgi:hypothetical protein